MMMMMVMKYTLEIERMGILWRIFIFTVAIPHGDLYTDSTLKKGRGLSQLQVVVEK